MSQIPRDTSTLKRKADAAELIFEGRVIANQPIDIPLNLADLSTGLYLVQIIANNGTNKTIRSLKLVKVN